MGLQQTTSRTRARRARPLAIALATMAALALATPLPAHALPATSVSSASIDGPNAAMVSGEKNATCAPRLVSGGGARTDQAVLSNGTHLNGMFPTPDGVVPSADGDVNPTDWMGAGAIGGQATSGVTTWAYAICLDSGPTSTVVVTADTPGPSATFTGVLATATCPAGTRLLSGGARTTPGRVGSLKPNGSFPSDASGNPILSGTNPSSWTAAGLNGGQPPADNATHAFAICATAGAANPTVTVQNARIDGPGDASTGGQVTTSCAPGAVLLGGGGWISDHFALPGSQGDHLTGSFPSDASGAPITTGVASSWTAGSHIGGTVSGPLTDTNVWAMCAVDPSSVAAGGSGPPKTGKTGPIAGGITTNQLLQSMREQMIPGGQAGKISTLLRKGGAKLPFKTLDGGRVVIHWSTVSVTVHGKKTRSILVGKGAKTFPNSGPYTVSVRLTAAGKRLLRRSRRVRLSAHGTFTRKGKPAINGTKAFVLTHAALSTEP